MGLGEEGKDDQGTRTKGISSEKYMVNYYGGGSGGSPYHPSGYPPHTGYPVHGYPVPASPPPPKYPGHSGYHYGSNQFSHRTDYHSPWPQPGYHSPPHVTAPPPAYGHDAYPYQYGGHGGHGKHQQEYHGGYGGYGKHQQQYHGGYGGYGKHQEEHDDYYRRHEEFDMYHHHQQGYGGGYNNHGYGKHQYGVTRGISDAKV